MMYLLTDHSGLNKFWGHDDPNFKLVCAVIEKMAGDAPLIVEQNYPGIINPSERLSYIRY